MKWPHHYRIGAFFNNALAMAIPCFCPPDNLIPSPNNSFKPYSCFE